MNTTQDNVILNSSGNPPDLNPKFTQVNESYRIYHYNNGNTIKIDGVDSISVSKSGTHRINSTNGKKYIIVPGWQYIEFESKDWSF